MRPELDDKLVATFPNLYTDRRASMQSTCMCWGFECGDGWFQLIWDLSQKLEALILSLPEKDRPHYRASQVKEKFGTLRFYMTAETPEMSDLIEVAERKSGETCERCGAAGKLRGPGWYYTSCDEHARPGSQTVTEEEDDGA